MPDASPTTPAPAATNQPTPRTSDINFKELVTAGIALAIVTTLIVMLWLGFGREAPLEEDQKYIIGILLSLAGTVTGYYFGRVPAEKQADAAKRAEDAAKEGKAVSDAKVGDAKKTLDRALSGQPAFKVRAAQDTTDNAAWQELEALRQRLS